MTALLISEIFPPRIGGSGRWFWEIYRRLPAGTCIVAAGEHPNQEDFDCTHSLPVIRSPLTLQEWGIRSPQAIHGYFRAFRSIRDIVRQHEIRNLHSGRLLPEGWIAWLLKKCYRLPYICYVHGEEMSYGIHSRELGWMMRRVLADASLVIANSQNSCRMLCDQWRVPSDRLRILNPGVDTERFVPAERDLHVRSKWEWGNRPVILTVGRLQQRKGHQHIIRVLPAIRSRVHDVLYAIVGEGEERRGLESLVQDLQLAEHVRIYGELDDQQLIQAYQQCDLFALPNYEVNGDVEGFGMVLVEAQACGRPVIAGNSGGTADTMQVGETGLLVDSANHELLASTMIELLVHPSRCQEMGRSGRRWAVDNFDWERLARVANDVFEEVTAQGSAPAKMASVA